MKKNCWLLLGAMLASSAVAQNNTNSLPEMPPPASSPAAETAPAPAPTAPEAVPAPASKPVKHKKARAATSARPHALKEPTVTLTPGPAEVTVSNLVVRGQAGLQGEVIGHLFQGDGVIVLSQINLDKHKAGEPAQWAKISYPTNAHVWLSAKYIDTNGTVSAKKLNLRAGPGENFSVVGVIERGTPVTQIATKETWMKIEPPTNAYAFVAAMYLRQEAPLPQPIASAPMETEPTPVPAPTPTPVAEAQPIVAQPNNAPPAEATAPAPMPAPAPEEITTTVTPPTRIVSHEGVVRHVGSIIAPTAYELYDPTTLQNLDFLNSTTTNLDLSRYENMRIIVTGEEELAARWSDVPVLTIQQIQVIETNAVPNRVYRSPRYSKGR